MEQLTLDDLSVKSTEIVYGKVSASFASAANGTIYTHYTVLILEQWKGNSGSSIEVVLPGGAFGRERQSFAGVPPLVSGRSYLMFLWTGSSGVTQLTGLTQGLFEISQNPGGGAMASRRVSSELMLDANGKVVHDQPLAMTLREMNQRVAAANGKRAVR